MNAAQRRLGKALVLSLAHLFHPRMLWLMLWPLLISATLWIGLTIALWTHALVWIVDTLQHWWTHGTFALSWSASGVVLLVAKVILLVALLPLIQLTALLILGVFGMPRIVTHVADRHYAALAQRRGGSFFGGLVNSVKAMLIAGVLFVIGLPLLFFPPVWAAVPVIAAAWLNQQVLRYDALALHATADELRTLIASRRWSWYLLGLLMALSAYVPIVGWLAPAYFGLVFAHVALDALQALRTAPIEGEITLETVEVLRIETASHTTSDTTRIS